MKRLFKQILPAFLILTTSCLIASSCRTIDQGGGFDLGFLASYDRALNGADRVRVFGPFYESQTMKDGKSFRAVRPLYNKVVDQPTKRSEAQILWPIGRTKQRGEDGDWRFFPSFGHDFDTDRSSRYRVFIPPCAFGRDVNGKGYFGLFPIGGAVNEFLGRDKIRFVLFPLYLSHSINDVVTRDFLWPITSWTKGDNIFRFRFLNLYGYSRTDQRVNKFILWPIWNSVKYISPERSGSGYVLFPFYGHAKINDSEMWMVLPPFFKYQKDSKNKELHCPYPFFQYQSGDTEKLYLWPLWGRKSFNHAKSYFILWPIVRGLRLERENVLMTRFSVFPFLYSEKGKKAATKEVKAQSSRELNIWPLFSYRRNNDKSQFRFPALLPGRHLESVDKNFTPLWTLYSRISYAGAVEHEVLWGLFRHRRDGIGGGKTSLFPVFSSSKDIKGVGQRKWSFLLGLIGYERQGLKKTYRFLYLPIIRTSGADKK